MNKLQHVIRAEQLVNPELLDELFSSASELERKDKARTLEHPLRGRILATLFYEPSTRTRFSFEAAMQKLGGGVLTAENALDNSSASKGETIADTMRIVSGYADAIALRHPQVGAAEMAAEASPVPVITATRMAESSRKSVHISQRRSCVSTSMAFFTSGRFNVT